jgi:hypothetical protein
MTVASNGLIQWTPQSNQTGNYEVEVKVTDTQGATATQSYTLSVVAMAINRAPSITSTPVFLAAVGSAYNYQVQAFDPDASDTLTYQLLEAPSGMTVNPTTGLVTWAIPTTGYHNIVVGAVDAFGLGVAQEFTLTARVNRAPVVNSTPSTAATPGSLYSYDVSATDADGDVLTFSLDSFSRSKGMTIDELGRLRFLPTNGDIGTVAIEITVSDGNGASVQQRYNLTVAADTVAPKVSLIASFNQINLGESVTFLARATDNIKVASVQLLVNNAPVALDAYGLATVTLNQLGTVTAQAILLRWQVHSDNQRGDCL